MHAVALTVAEILAVGTLARTHPFALTIGRITVLPNLHEVVFVDIALMVVGSDAGTGSNRTIGHHRTHRYTCLTSEQPTTHIAFVVAKEALAAVVYTNTTLLA